MIETSGKTRDRKEAVRRPALGRCGDRLPDPFFIKEIEKLVTAFFLLNGIFFDILALQDRSFLHKLFIWKSIAQVSHVTVLRLLRVVAHGRTDEFFRDVIAIKLRTLQSGFEIDDLRIDQ